MQFTVWAWKKKTIAFTVTAFTLLSQISKVLAIIYCLDYVFTGQIARFSNSVVDVVLCSCTTHTGYVLPQLAPGAKQLVLSENNNKNHCVVLKTICFRVCSQKEVWTRPHQFCLPLLTQSSLTFSQQILHPQTTPHAFKPHDRACKTPTQFLAIKTPCKWAATQLPCYYIIINAQNEGKRVNHFISRFQDPEDALAKSGM